MTVHDLSTTNGRAHHQSGGRDVPTYDFTFRDTGRKVRIKYKVSPYFGDKIRKEFITGNPARNLAPHPEPQPPIEKVPVNPSDPNATMDVPNDQDETYRRARAHWIQQLSEWSSLRLLDHIIERCIDLSDIDQEAVDDYKRHEGDEGLSDAELYIRFICIGSAHDLNDLITFVTERSQPTAEQINDKVLSFRQEI